MRLSPPLWETLGLFSGQRAVGPEQKRGGPHPGGPEVGPWVIAPAPKPLVMISGPPRQKPRWGTPKGGPKKAIDGVAGANEGKKPRPPVEFGPLTQGGFYGNEQQIFPVGH